jgi:hypothetical protein
MALVKRGTKVYEVISIYVRPKAMRQLKILAKKDNEQGSVGIMFKRTIEKQFKLKNLTDGT